MPSALLGRRNYGPGSAVPVVDIPVPVTLRPSDWLDPPTLSNPDVIAVATDGTATLNGVTNSSLTNGTGWNAAGADVRIDWPSASVTGLGSLRINGARHIVCMAGRVWPDQVSGQGEQGLFEFINCTGTVHMERMYINMGGRQYRSYDDNGTTIWYTGDVLAVGGDTGSSIPADFSDTSSHRVDVRMQGCRIMNIKGQFADSGAHADLIQPRGAMGDVRVIDVTNSTDYQTFLWQPMSGDPSPTTTGKYWGLKRFNCYGLVRQAPEPGEPAQLFYMHTNLGSARKVYDVRFFDDDTVWAEPATGFTLWDHCGPPFDSDGVTSYVFKSEAGGGRLQWSSNTWGHGVSGIETAPNADAQGGFNVLNDESAFETYLSNNSAALGKVNEGVPPGGDYCPLPSEAGDGSDMCGWDSGDYAP